MTSNAARRKVLQAWLSTRWEAVAVAVAVPTAVPSVAPPQAAVDSIAMVIAMVVAVVGGFCVTPLPLS